MMELVGLAASGGIHPMSFDEGNAWLPAWQSIQFNNNIIGNK